MTMIAQSHVVMWTNASLAARDALSDSRAGSRGIPALADALMIAMGAHFEDGIIPDINALYLFGEQIDGAFVAVACKPRGFRRAIQQVGWAVAFVSESQLDTLIAVDEDARNRLLLSMIKPTPEQAEKWVTVY